MLAKIWKKLLLAICIIACLYNVMNKIVKHTSLDAQLKSVLQTTFGDEKENFNLTKDEIKDVTGVKNETVNEEINENSNAPEIITDNENISNEKNNNENINESSEEGNNENVEQNSDEENGDNAEQNSQTNGSSVEEEEIENPVKSNIESLYEESIFKYF